MEAHFSPLVIEALLESKLTNRLYQFIIFPGKKFYTIYSQSSPSPGCTEEYTWYYEILTNGGHAGELLFFQCE